MLSQENITLRPLTISDKAGLVTLANNKNISDNLRDQFPHPYTNKDAEQLLADPDINGKALRFAVEYEGEFCGMIGLHFQDDVYSNTAEIGYWIGEPFWNKGIGTAAVKLATDYGLNELGLRRIYAGIYAYNVRSGRILEKCGYQKEGILVKAVLKNGKVWDEVRYGITK